MIYMSTNLPETEILKTDVLGRVKMSVERREAILDEFERSGVAGAPFAEMIGVKYTTFATWVQKRKKARGQYPCIAVVKKSKGAVRFVEAVGAREPESSLTIELPGGARVSVGTTGEMEAAGRLLSVLAQKKEGAC